MEINIGRQLGAVTREVGGREYEGKPAKVVVLAQTYQTTPDDLWEAVTSAERIPRWLLPITGDLKLGGRYQLVGNASGTILVCDRPRHLKVTWEYDGKTSWVEAAIESAPNGSSRLTVEHWAHADDSWTQFGPGAAGVGWDLMVLGLALHLETGGSVTEEGMKWLMSDEGKAFVRHSSDAWFQADLAGGENPEVAKAAAERTATAYGG